ncbi:glycosyltransferase [Dyella japonica]|uniref:Glycosyltransferase 2-like domain-containing protein n=1 Tax=Dyella japonica A8 TaxID=1217721 RepID=A0A075K6Y8_9GAMM|nr:glycosyltransferase [Dyella japonica]AIF49382.1 hypothetical protein HY57_20030 [Dyella japonica A8]
MIRSVTAVVTFHREGEYARTALASIERCRAYAEKRGLSVNFAMTLDNGDATTEEAIVSHGGLRDDDRLFHIDLRDLSLSRNYAIAHSASDVVATFDGDDLFSENWLYEAVSAIKQHGPATIVHPELIVAFGGWTAYWYQMNQSDPRFRPESLLSINHWNACSAARREVFERCPYVCARVGESGFGFEDWHWNCETIAAGYVHRVAPRTLRAERRKLSGSLNVGHQDAGAVIRRTAMFDRVP